MSEMQGEVFFNRQTFLKGQYVCFPSFLELRLLVALNSAPYILVQQILNKKAPCLQHFPVIS
jgi:hypothetical protein